MIQQKMSMLSELFNNKCNGKHLVSTYLYLPLSCIVQKHYHLIFTTITQFSPNYKSENGNLEKLNTMTNVTHLVNSRAKAQTCLSIAKAAHLITIHLCLPKINRFHNV